MAILDEVKAALRVTHSDDDALLTRLIESASREALQYINGGIEPGTLTEVVTGDVLNGIVLLVQQDYEGDPGNREQIRRVAQTLWNPYRITPLGV